MRWNITRKRMAWAILILITILALVATAGCTKRQEKNATETGGAISRAFGLPSFVGEAIAVAICSAVTAVGGHKHGRRKERSCSIRKPPVAS